VLLVMLVIFREAAHKRGSVLPQSYQGPHGIPVEGEKARTKRQKNQTKGKRILLLRRVATISTKRFTSSRSEGLSIMIDAEKGASKKGKSDRKMIILLLVC